MPTLVRGRVVLVAEAYDRRDLRVPGVWNDMPVTPALVSWQLRMTVLPEHTAARPPEHPGDEHPFHGPSQRSGALIGSRFPR